MTPRALLLDKRVLDFFDHRRRRRLNRDLSHFAKERIQMSLSLKASASVLTSHNPCNPLV